MKKTVLLALLVLLAIPVMSQAKKYRKAMKEAIEKMHEAADPSAELELVKSFEAIAEEYPDQWLPSYHASRILITSSFEEPDGAKSDTLLKKAKKELDKALKLAPGESEVYVLESLYYIGLMSVDPMSRGQMYYQDALYAIDKSLELNPDNPRAYYMDGMMTLNMPDFMGGGAAAARPIFGKAAEKFSTYRNEDPFWPAWGEEMNKDGLKSLDQ